MNQIWVHKAKSHREAEIFDIAYYSSMSPAKRLQTIQYLRELADKLQKESKRGRRRKGLRRIIKVVQ